MTYILLAAGLVLLLFGGELLVRGSVGLARRLGISELLIGITLVGFGTSVPELITSVQAANQGFVGMSVGNVVGSNIANILLVIGLAAVIAPIVTKPSALARDLVVMTLVTAVFLALAYQGQITLLAGALMVAALLVYLVASVVADREDAGPGQMHKQEAELVGGEVGLAVSAVMSLAGIAGVIYGAHLLVTHGVVLAAQLGVSDTLVGLTIVAIGTSLPELATSLTAAFRGKADVAVGNVIGSNIFNILGVLGITALVRPIDFTQEVPLAPEALNVEEVLRVSEPETLLSYGTVGMLVLSVVLLILFALTGRRIARWEGLVLVTAYAAYLGYLFGLAP